MEWLTLRLAVLVSMVVLGIPGLGHADESASEDPFGLSDLEWRLVKKMMARHALTPMSRDEAAGKMIEAIVIAPEEVFTPEDLFPDVLNMFHATSRPSIIRREVLLDEGEPFDREQALQSERNLRGPLVLSIALVLPMEGSAPDKVKVLVVTKDIWSLRTNTNFQVVGGALDFLSLSLSENNIAGLHKFAALTMLLRPESIRLGEVYLDPRFLGTRLRLSETFSVPLNLDSGEAEGFTAILALERPLFSLRTEWGFEARLTAHTAIGRNFLGGQLRQVPVSNDPALPIAGLGAEILRDPLGGVRGADPLGFEAFSPPALEGVSMPFNWRERIFEAQISATRSFGREVKQNVSWGYEIGVQRFSFGEDEGQRQRFSARQVRLFEDNLLPRSEFVGAVFASYRIFTPDFVPLRNFETLALPEDFRFGPSLQLSARHADPALGSEVRFETFAASYTHRWMLGAGRGEDPSRNADIVVFDARSSTRLQDADFIDNTFRLTLRNYTPTFFAGRLVNEAVFLHRVDDQSNSLTTLGGGSGLRGFESGQFLGRSAMTSNVEWRTLPTELFTLQFGAVAFYDTAGIANEEDLSDLAFFHSVGLGGRLVNPISNRIVMRFDWGLPLNGPGSGFPGRLSFGFEQAF